MISPFLSMKRTLSLGLIPNFSLTSFVRVIMNLDVVLLRLIILSSTMNYMLVMEKSHTFYTIQVW